MEKIDFPEFMDTMKRVIEQGEYHKLNIIVFKRNMNDGKKLFMNKRTGEIIVLHLN